MPYKMLRDVLPEVAENETRSLLVRGEDSEHGLPEGDYHFVEMYCDERGCDCRRVFFYVRSPGWPDPAAVIAWGWETPEFYAKWMGDNDPTFINEMIGPTLNLGSPQTEISPALLEFTAEKLLQDDAYVERIKRHYWQFRDKIEGKSDRLLRRKQLKKRLKKRRKK